MKRIVYALSVAVFMAAGASAQAQSKEFTLGQWVELHNAILKELNRSYVDSLEVGRIEREGVDAMLNLCSSVGEVADCAQDAARYLGCQFVIASHSPVLLSIPDAVIYDLDEDPVRIKKWTELENVRKYFEFFESHRQEFLTNDEPNGGDSYEA